MHLNIDKCIALFPVNGLIGGVGHLPSNIRDALSFFIVGREPPKAPYYIIIINIQ